MSLNLTPRAQYALEDYVTKHGQPVRLSINPGGCSGFDIAFASGTTEPDDLRFGDSGELIIDPVSLSLISGATVDLTVLWGGLAVSDSFVISLGSKTITTVVDQLRINGGLQIVAYASSANQVNVHVQVDSYQ